MPHITALKESCCICGAPNSQGDPLPVRVWLGWTLMALAGLDTDGARWASAIVQPQC